jgi:hypothetical protein
MSSLLRYAFHSAALCSFAWYLLSINQTKVNPWVNVKNVRSLLGFSHGGSRLFDHFREVPNHTLGYQNHSVGCYHFGRPRLCVYTAHSSSADTRKCLLYMRASSDPPRRLPAPHFKAKHKSTPQHIFCLLLRHLPFQVLLYPTYQTTTNTHPTTVRFSFYKVWCCLSHVVTYLTQCLLTHCVWRQKITGPNNK